MYTAGVQVKGVAPLMQHRYPLPDFATIQKGSKKSTGAKDYTSEWKDYLYTNGSGIYQPAIHFEACMLKAATSFKIAGKKGKSYKDLFSGFVRVTPDHIAHGVPTPDELDFDADKSLYLDLRPVVVQRARVARIRPVFKEGWTLDFDITVDDDELHWQVLKDVLEMAGRTIGIGDFRPRFGRFTVTKFEVHQ
jgi:hypothetical protein